MKKCNTAPVAARHGCRIIASQGGGISVWLPGTHRYQLTELGRRTALFYSRTFNRVLRPGLSQIAHPNLPPDSSNLTAAFHYLEAQLTNYLSDKKAA
jgi:hypothetical protein